VTQKAATQVEETADPSGDLKGKSPGLMASQPPSVALKGVCQRYSHE
jgi:hypothetical protein